MLIFSLTSLKESKVKIGILVKLTLSMNSSYLKKKRIEPSSKAKLCNSNAKYFIFNIAIKNWSCITLILISENNENSSNIKI